jgi:hypothetical protein
MRDKPSIDQYRIGRLISGIFPLAGGDGRYYQAFLNSPFLTKGIYSFYTSDLRNVKYQEMKSQHLLNNTCKLRMLLDYLSNSN